MKARTQPAPQNACGQTPKIGGSVIFDPGASAEPTDIARDKNKTIGDAVWEDYLEETGQKPKTWRQ
jgi:hypothetical protein